MNSKLFANANYSNSHVDMRRPIVIIIFQGLNCALAASGHVGVGRDRLEGALGHVDSHEGLGVLVTIGDCE